MHEEIGCMKSESPLTLFYTSLERNRKISLEHNQKVFTLAYSRIHERCLSKYLPAIIVSTVRFNTRFTSAPPYLSLSMIMSKPSLAHSLRYKGTLFEHHHSELRLILPISLGIPLLRCLAASLFRYLAASVFRCLAMSD